MIARVFTSLSSCILFSGLLWGAPELTTIADVLYKADGTRFNGLVQFTWINFESGNGSNIAQQSKTVRIIDGNLYVQLTPTTNAVPPGQYAVKYNSDGRIQFSETWAVPPATATLRVRDVRTTEPVFPPNGGLGAITQINESDVIGLVADLQARPLKSPGYTNSRALFVNQLGELDGVLGSLNDCVRVDGSSGPCSSSTLIFVDAETPGGVVDGANRTFTLAVAPAPSTSLHVFRNGLLQKLSFDYSLNGTIITFVPAASPQPADTILVSYRH